MSVTIKVTGGLNIEWGQIDPKVTGGLNSSVYIIPNQYISYNLSMSLRGHSDACLVVEQHLKQPPPSPFRHQDSRGSDFHWLKPDISPPLSATPVKVFKHEKRLTAQQRYRYAAFRTECNTTHNLMSQQEEKWTRNTRM